MNKLNKLSVDEKISLLNTEQAAYYTKVLFNLESLAARLDLNWNDIQELTSRNLQKGGLTN